jgi:hypothetical protein
VAIGVNEVLPAYLEGESAIASSPASQDIDFAGQNSADRLRDSHADTPRFEEVIGIALNILDTHDG